MHIQHLLVHALRKTQRTRSPAWMLERKDCLKGELRTCSLLSPGGRNEKTLAWRKNSATLAWRKPWDKTLTRSVEGSIEMSIKAMGTRKKMTENHDPITRSPAWRPDRKPKHSCLKRELQTLAWSENWKGSPVWRPAKYEEKSWHARLKEALRYKPLT